MVSMGFTERVSMGSTVSMDLAKDRVREREGKSSRDLSLME